jgi:hypothetical protein
VWCVLPLSCRPPLLNYLPAISKLFTADSLLTSLNISLQSIHPACPPARPPACSVEAKMAMLVEAPAAVEDALASLLDHTDPVVRRRALATYAKRLYHPFLLHEPELREVGDALLAGQSAACLRPGVRLHSITVLCEPSGRQWLHRIGTACASAPALTVPARLPALPASNLLHCLTALQSGHTTMWPWPQPPSAASAMAAPSSCAACTTCPLR